MDVEFQPASVLFAFATAFTTARLPLSSLHESKHAIIDLPFFLR